MRVKQLPVSLQHPFPFIARRSPEGSVNGPLRRSEHRSYGLFHKRSRYGKVHPDLNARASPNETRSQATRGCAKPITSAHRGSCEGRTRARARPDGARKTGSRRHEIVRIARESSRIEGVAQLRSGDLLRRFPRRSKLAEVVRDDPISSRVKKAFVSGFLRYHRNCFSLNEKKWERSISIYEIYKF